MKLRLFSHTLATLTLAALASASAATTPDDATAVAWFRGGDQEFNGTPCHFLGRADMQVAFDVKPQAGATLEMLRTETKLTCRVDRLPDDYSFSKKGWRREKIELDAIIFDGAEYVKDGLLPITEWLGKSPWSERAIGIIEDIWKNAPVETPSGKIPTLNFEVNGDLLQACSRLFWFTGERKYLDWAIRLGDHHPTRDMKNPRFLAVFSG